MAKLEEDSCYQYTDTNGVAKFDLKFLAGKPGPYILVFQSQTTRSDFSKTINLLNNVSSIKLLNPTPEIIV